ncbi:Haloacid dehalogenase domain protein hydrolase [Sphaerochaeta globosa str. Buddy]|uniref:phosphoglycolate phosphatase n=2 Tax=Sphaerochaeta TaxID=399320 RepID=F0RRI8_SPHGB|nr:HAD family hydrolase [Sphaerochaeta globosa]ADY14240.1 Haloacid dehalogenase domain protein hydrolase [Sphaerochaeta globosa str. Buddy]
MREVDSLLFDLDGTLWSPLPLSLHCWNEACRVNSVSSENVTEENLRLCFGRSSSFIRSTLVQSYSSSVQRKVCETAFGLENQNIAYHTNLLYPLVKETLERLSVSYPLFIVSNCQPGYIEAFLESYHLAHLFIDFRSSEENGLSKHQNIADLVRIYALDHPIYIGDTQLDAEAASLAHVPFIYATYGFGSVPEAGFAISNFSDLPKLLTQ